MNLVKLSVSLYHIAGYSDQKSFYFDAHDSDTPESIWDLYKAALRRICPRRTIIERDENIPETEVLLQEVTRAKGMIKELNDSEIHP